MKELKDKIISFGIVKNGMFNRSCSRPDRELFHKLKSLENDILLYTDFLPNNTSIIERVYYIVNGYNEILTCNINDCENIPQFINFKRGYNKYCSKKCYYNDVCNQRHWTESRSDEDKEKIFKKIVETRRGNGSYHPSKSTRIKMSESAKKSMDRKRETCKKKYGVTNPGVLGGNSSNSARSYIKSFINTMCLDNSLCMYDDGENGKEEFWQIIEVPFMHKLRYTKYDLVVFKDKESFDQKDIKGITLVLEYNGPWHYRLSDIDVSDYNTPATPYPNSMSKIESIQLDEAKRQHLNHVENYCVFWGYNHCLYMI